MINIIFENKNNNTVITIEGNTVINNANTIHDKLKNLESDIKNKVIIDINKITEADISFIQILISFKKLLDKKKKKVSFNYSKDDNPVIKALYDMGLEKDLL